MIIHEEEAPIEVPVLKNPHMESKKYVVVKNHVRELNTDDVKQASTYSGQRSSSETDKKGKKNKETKKKKRQIAIAEIGDKTNIEQTEISQSDLEELRMVYRKCKDVLSKIETKYGHMLDLEESGISNQRTANKECHCSTNTKIIFDDNGQQIIKQPDMDYHALLCSNKLKRRHSDYSANRNIQIEYAKQDISLPDDLPSLTSILRDPNTVTTYRNAVINKIRITRQEYVDEIRFNRHALIEKLKTDPSDVLDFKGTNLDSLPGYPDWK